MHGRTRVSGWLLGVLVGAIASPGCGEAGDDPEAGDAVDSPEAGADADAEADAAADVVPDVVDEGEEDGGVEVDPSAPGAYTWTVVDDTVVRGTRSTPVSALVPDLPPGVTAPLVLFLPGFQMRTAWYLPYCERLASHGFVVVRADPPASLFDSSHPESALDARAALDWALDPAGAVGPHVDPSRIGASGHSAGGKVSTMLAFADDRVGALLGLDPVNGSGPMGYTPQQPDIVPDQVAPLAIPIGLMGETTDATGGLGGQACAPAAQNFLTFYEAAASSPWVASWELSGADHIDFVFDTSSCGLPCGMCRSGSADEAQVHRTILTLAVAFFRYHFLGETSHARVLLGDDLPPDVVLQHRP